VGNTRRASAPEVSHGAGVRDQAPVPRAPIRGPMLASEIDRPPVALRALAYLPGPRSTLLTTCRAWVALLTLPAPHPADVRVHARRIELNSNQCGHLFIVQRQSPCTPRRLSPTPPLPALSLSLTCMHACTHHARGLSYARTLHAPTGMHYQVCIRWAAQCNVCSYFLIAAWPRLYERRSAWYFMGSSVGSFRKGRMQPGSRTRAVQLNRLLDASKKLGRRGIVPCAC